MRIDIEITEREWKEYIEAALMKDYILNGEIEFKPGKESRVVIPDPAPVKLKPQEKTVRCISAQHYASRPSMFRSYARRTDVIYADSVEWFV